MIDIGLHINSTTPIWVCSATTWKKLLDAPLGCTWNGGIDFECSDGSGWTAERALYGSLYNPRNAALICEGRARAQATS